jgi:CheY-like chemotaxis protein
MLDGKRIFLLEDDVNNLAIIMSILKRNKASVLYDTWGTATVKKISKNLPLDLIILDLMLPGGISGYDVFAEIKQIPDLIKIPVVVVTAADPSVEMPKARNLGFSGYISKPVRNRTFPLALSQIMEGEAVWGEADILLIWAN